MVWQACGNPKLDSSAFYLLFKRYFLAELLICDSLFVQSGLGLLFFGSKADLLDIKKDLLLLRR